MIIICFCPLVDNPLENGSPLNVFPTASPDLFFLWEGEAETPRQNSFFFKKEKQTNRIPGPWQASQAMPPSKPHSGGTSSHLYHCSSKKGDRQDFQFAFIKKYH